MIYITGKVLFWAFFGFYMDNGLCGITLRPALPGDLGRICALERACSRNPWSRAAVEGGLSNPNSVFFVLQGPGGRIVGFACSALVLDELQILEVAVSPEYRNSGLGAALINRLLSEASAKGAVRACLEVRTRNHCAIRVYEKCGFKMDGTRKGYYQDGEDAVLMSKSL